MRSTDVQAEGATMYEEVSRDYYGGYEVRILQATTEDDEYGYLILSGGYEFANGDGLSSMDSAKGAAYDLIDYCEAEAAHAED